MTPGTFKSIACAILGDNTYWQKPIARRLGVSRETVRRWMMLEQVPHHAATAITELWIGPVTPQMLLSGREATYQAYESDPNHRMEQAYRAMREHALREALCAMRNQANGS